MYRYYMETEETTDAILFTPSTSNSNHRRAFPATNSSVSRRDVPGYNMNHKNRGLAIIFNQYSFDDNKNSTRKGTQFDCNKCKSTLKKLGFQVHIFDDLTCRKIKEVVKLAAEEDHTYNDCILITILSHGSLTHISARDVEYKLEDIYNLLTPQNCPTLKGKPKIFFVQTCQGHLWDKGYPLGGIETDSFSITTSSKLPSYADFFIASATFPGYAAFRDPQSGSWFIQSLCHELDKSGKGDDIDTIMNRVKYRVSRYETNDQLKQMPTVLSTLRLTLQLKN